MASALRSGSSTLHRASGSSSVVYGWENIALDSASANWSEVAPSFRHRARSSAATSAGVFPGPSRLSLTSGDGSGPRVRTIPAGVQSVSDEARDLHTPASGGSRRWRASCLAELGDQLRGLRRACREFVFVVDEQP